MEVFEGPQLTPPTISLLTAADIIPMEGERWERGFDLINEGVEFDFATLGTGLFSGSTCGPLDPVIVPGGSGSTEDYAPFVLYATDKCSTWPAKREFYDRAQRKLLAAEALVLEGQLWTGITTNPFLADGAGVNNVQATTTIPMTATSAKDAFAVLEQAMVTTPTTGFTLSMTRGMIHVRVQVLHALLEAQVVRRVGNIYLSPMDNIVVPGRGYPGTGPAGEAVGATEWMYGHPGIVQVRRGPILRIGEDDMASQVDRYVNDRFAIVQRVSHVALDSTKGVYAIEFNSIS